MISLLLALLTSQVAPKPTVKASEPEPVAPLCLTLVLERNRYWFGATGNALEPGPYASLSEKYAEIRRAFPDANEILIAPASDVPREWTQDAVLLLRQRGLRRFAISDGALAAAAKKAPSTDWIGKDAKWARATLLPLLRSQCQDRLKANGFQDEAPRLLPSSPPPVASRPKPSSADALKGVTMCGAAAKVPGDLSMGVLASECSRIASCAGGCAQGLMAMIKPELAPVGGCAEFPSFQKTCSPVSARACQNRFILSMVRGFVEAGKTAPLGPDLEKACAPLLLP